MSHQEDSTVLNHYCCGARSKVMTQLTIPVATINQRKPDWRGRSSQGAGFGPF